MKRIKARTAVIAVVAAGLLTSGVAYVATDNTPSAGDRVTLVNGQCSLGDFQELTFKVPADGQTSEGIVTVGTVPVDDYAPPTEDNSPFTVKAMGDGTFVFRGLKEGDPTIGAPTDEILAVGHFHRDGEMTIDVVNDHMVSGPVDGLESDKWEPGDHDGFESAMESCWLGEDS